MKFFLLLFLSVLSVPVAFAQNSSDYNRFEVSGGFSHQRAGDTSGFDDSAAFNGFDTSVTGNFHRYIGIKGALSGAYRKDEFVLPGFAPNTVLQFSINTSIYTYMGGIQIKDNAKSKKFKPFFHVLAGGVTLKQKLTGDCPTDVVPLCSGFSYTDSGFSAAIGGGLDVRASKRISIRVLQADYNPLFLGGDPVNNFRIGAGVVFH